MRGRREAVSNGPAGQLIAATRRRLVWRDALVGTAAATMTLTALRTAGVLWDGSSRVVDTGALLAGTLIGLALFQGSVARRSRVAAAHTAEAVHPAFRNLLVTAEELERHPERAEPSIRAYVVEQADGVAAGAKGRQAVPTRRLVAPALVVVAGVTVNLLLAGRMPGRAALERAGSVIAALASPSRATRMTVTVTPPAYVGTTPQTLDNPDRIDALAGSHLVFVFESRPQVRIRFGATELTGPRPGHVVRSSGYFVIESDGSEERRFVPLTARSDAAPRVTITTPGKDMLIAVGDRTVPIDVTASDDLALRSLELRFTRVSGSGEQFEFEEGSLPIAIERRSAREWRGSGTLSLPRLKLAPGDSLVYRAASRDGRAGDEGLAFSDTYFVEILGPGQAAFEGIEMPPELERSGLSQQMIVLKLQRLRAEEQTLARESLIERSGALAAEQRTVRANFIFLLGGHVEDEFEEAAHSHEIQEGRLENTARRDINAAVAHMTRAEQGMTALNMQAALASAREAVTALQRAFGRNRYLLRSLAVRSRLDPARRLTGATEDASDWRRMLEPRQGREGERARALLNAVMSAGRRWASAPPAPAREVDALAEALLAVDPSAAPWRQAAQRVLDARTAASSSELTRVITDVADLLRDQAAVGVLRRVPVPGQASPLRRAYEAERR